MTFEDIHKELLSFGFTDITAQRFEKWKLQKVLRYGHSFFVIFDEPNVELFRDATQCDYSIGVSQANIRGLLAFLKLKYNDRRIIQKHKLLHLNELYNEMKNNRYHFEQISYKRFAREYEELKFNHLKCNEYLIISE